MVRVYNILEDKRKRIFHAEVNLLVLLAIFIAAMVNFSFPILRLTNDFSNHLFMLIVLFIPILLLINGFFLKGFVFKMLNFIIFIIPGVAAILFAGTIILDSMGNVQHFQAIDRISVENYSLNIYRSDAVTLGGEGMVIRQEKEFFPGLLLVKDIYHTNNKNGTTYKLENDVLVIEGEKYQLHKYLYF